MNVMARAKPGYEAEFEEVLASLNAPDKPVSGLLGRLFAKTRPSDRDALVARFQDITDAAYTQLGAPVCGVDTQADDWLRERYESGQFGDGISLKDVQAQMAGYHVLDLLRPSDGLPVYSNGGLGYDVDETSFRGQFLNDCSFLHEDDLLQSWSVMNSQQLASFGEMLSTRARAYAEAEGVLSVLDQQASPENPESPEWRAHIAISCAKWAKFWSDLGHGMEPYF